MSFSRMLGAVLLVTLSACGVKTGEPPVETGPIEIGGDSTGCLGDVRALWNRLYDGQATEAEISNFWNCASDNVKTFKNRVKGKKSDTYTFAELRAFLRKFFLSEQQITDTMLREVMYIKAMLVGGQPNSLTHREIDQIQHVFEQLSKILVEYKDLFPLNEERVLALPESSRRDYEARLKGALVSVARAVSLFARPFPRERIFSFLFEIQKVVARIKFDALLTRMDLWSSLKSLMLTTPYDGLESKDWVPLAETLGDGYSLYMDLRLFEKTEGVWNRGEKLQRLRPALSSFQRLLSSVIARYPDKTIPFAKIDRAIEWLRADEIPMGLRHGVLKDFLRPLFRRLLSGRDRTAQGRLAAGFTLGMLNRACDEAGVWMQRQIALDRLYWTLEREEGQRLSKHGLSESSFLKRKLLEVLDSPSGKEQVWPGWASSDAAKRVLKELRLLIQDSDSIYRGTAKEAYFDPVTAFDALSFHNVSELHWMRVLSVMAGRAYISDPERMGWISTAFTKPEFREFIEDLIPAGVDLKWVDPDPERQKTLPMSRFREANLFTYVGNGNALVEGRELAQLIALILSGNTYADRVHAIIYRQCPHKDANAYGFPYIEAKCYVRVFQERIDDILKNSPGMLAFFKGQSDAGRADLLFWSGKAVEVDLNARSWITLSDTQMMLVMYQYIEVIFKAFDQVRLDDRKNSQRDGVLDPIEAMSAYPRFKREISDAIGITDEFKLKGGFHYLLNYGAMPQRGWDKGELFINQQFNRWNYRADRLILIKIFKAILDLSQKK